jgi:preprotein translocase subunit SecG
MSKVAALRVIVTVIYVLVSIALTVIVLMQEGKTEGLSGAISGAADTYWGKNKGRSMEGAMNRITRYLAVAFIVLSVVLNLKWW